MSPAVGRAFKISITANPKSATHAASRFGVGSPAQRCGQTWCRSATGQLNSGIIPLLQGCAQ
jgi:hypothetical protein